MPETFFYTKIRGCHIKNMIILNVSVPYVVYFLSNDFLKYF